MRSTTLLLALALAGLQAMAQRTGYQGTIGGTIGAAVPQGEFADTWGHEMFTFGGVLVLPSQRLPLQWGFDFGYAAMGREVMTVPVSDPALAVDEGRLSVNAKTLNYNALLRLSPSKGKVRPYLDGLAGFRQFTTKSSITVQGLHEPLRKERNANDLVLNAGWAAGLMVTLGGTGYIEARVERFHSGQASYVDGRSIALDPDGNLGFDTLESGTGTLNVLLGVGFRF